MPSRALRIAASLLLLTSAYGVQAQQPFPVSTLKIIVPFGASSASDPVARKLGTLLAKQMGITVVIENREGASGTVGAIATAQSPANGSTIFFAANPPFSSVPLLQQKPAYDPEGQFTPIARVMTSALIIVGSKSAPFSNFEQLRDYTRQHPGKVNYASSGSGSASHLNTEALKLATGIDITFVPYRNTGQQMTDVIGGQIELNVPSLPGGYPMVKAGRVNAIAVGSLKRSTLMPDVPTFAEVSGRADLEAVVWYGILGPKGLPGAIVDRLSREIAEALRQPDMIAQIETIGAEPSFQEPAVFAASIGRGIADSKRLIQHLKIPLQD